MGKAYGKEIWRSIKKSKKRFLSILLITALGVTVLTGIYAACQDLYLSADRFYDEQKLFDIRVLSTLGLTEEDVAALGQVSGIQQVDGAYSETVYTEVASARQTAELTALSQNGLNTPYLLAGALPVRTGEIAVPQQYLDATGKRIGDSLAIEEEMEPEADALLEENGVGGSGAEPVAKPAAEAATKTANSESNLDTEVNWDADVDVEEEAEKPNFPRTAFTITGVVQDSMDISDSSNAFRVTSTSDYTFFVTRADVETDVYTTVYMTLAGLEALNCFSAEYEDAVQGMIDTIEAQSKQQREQARYDAVMAEALAIITDAESLMEEKFGEADSLFADAWAEIEDAKKELVDGEAELTQEERDALQKLAEARAKLEDGKQQLRNAEGELALGASELAAGQAEWSANAQKLQEGRAQLTAARQEAEAQFAQADRQLAEQQAKLDESRAQLEAGVLPLKAAFGPDWPGAEWDALAGAAAAQTAALLAADPETDPDPLAVAGATTGEQAALGTAIAMLGNPALAAMAQDTVQAALGLGMVNGAQQVLAAQQAGYEAQKAAARQQLAASDAELTNGEALLEEGRLKLVEGRAQLDAGAAQMAEAWVQLNEGEAELNAEEAKALREIADAWRDIADGKQELADGERELVENQQSYLGKKAEAEEKLADAYEELGDIDMAEWYVQNRTSLNSYASLKSDLSSIEAVGNAFPIVFLIVAILISLTTMTRMVEEERGLIGTYKALGFGDGAIYRKYLLYAFSACLLGGLVGDVFGFIFLPKFLIWVLQNLYILPNVFLRFDVWYGLGGILLFMVGIVGATALACRSELAQMPAGLLRPKAPRAGSRVFLERIPFIWNRMKFLNKVTARNLFRYKKRLFMTVLGIAGCTALIIAGFAIRDSVTDLMPKQYDTIYRYDLMVVTEPDDNDAWMAQVEEEAYIADWINFQTGSVTVQAGEGHSESAQLMVVPAGASIESYISTRDTGGAPVHLDSSGIFVTQNAAELLGIQPGDTVGIRDEKLNQGQAVVSGVVQNYLGNHVYITQELYETLFGPYAPNAMLAHLAADCPDQAAYAEHLLDNDAVLSAVSIAALKTDFATNFTMINAVVYVIIVLAAGLAFVVLFTLSNTNISERVRELATTKVLGFFDREVHAYVNKETLILTALGILIGLPVGRMVGGLLTAVLKMPSLYFAVHVQPTSYLIAAVVSFCFALVVNLMTNRTLDRINMVEALKSVE